MADTPWFPTDHWSSADARAGLIISHRRPHLHPPAHSASASADLEVGRLAALADHAGTSCGVGGSPDRVRARLIVSVTRRGASCSSMCPAPGSCTSMARGMPAARSWACAGGVSLAAPPAMTVVAAEIEPSVWYWS